MLKIQKRSVNKIKAVIKRRVELGVMSNCVYILYANNLMGKKAIYIKFLHKDWSNEFFIEFYKDCFK